MEINKEAIKQTTQTKGWKEIEKMIEEEKQKIRDTMSIDTDDKMTSKKIAIKVQAKNEAFKAFERLFKRIKNIENEKDYRRKPLI